MAHRYDQCSDLWCNGSSIAYPACTAANPSFHSALSRNEHADKLRQSACNERHRDADCGERERPMRALYLRRISGGEQVEVCGVKRHADGEYHCEREEPAEQRIEYLE